MRVIARPHQRPRLHVPESHLHRLRLHLRELSRRVVARHRQMILRRPQVLADGQDVARPRAARSRKTASSSSVSSPRPTITPLLVTHRRIQLLCRSRAVAATARSARPSAPRDRAAAPSPCCGSAPRAARPPRGGSPLRGPGSPGSALRRWQPGACRRISSITIAKTRAPPTRSSSRFTLVTTACFRPSVATASATRRGSSKSIGSGRPLGTAQKSAAPRAQVAQHHEGGRLVVPALADVRALRALAHGVQVQRARQPLQVVVVLAHRGAFAFSHSGFGPRTRGAYQSAPGPTLVQKGLAQTESKWTGMPEDRPRGIPSSIVTKRTEQMNDRSRPLNPLISRVELRAALQPRKQLRIRRLFNIEREQIALFLGRAASTAPPATLSPAISHRSRGFAAKGSRSSGMRSP